MNNIFKYNFEGRENFFLFLIKSEIIGRKVISSIIQPELFQLIKIQTRTFAHSAPISCISFDRTGKYIVTGSDDYHIKIFSSVDGRLLATLIGHEKEISDIDINFENTLIASGSIDKSIRIWDLKTRQNIKILNGHNSMVNSVKFSPAFCEEKRWMASSSLIDAVICFWQWNFRTLAFSTKPKKFIEKEPLSGTTITSLAFSPDGSILAAGTNEHHMKVFFLKDFDPIKIAELENPRINFGGIQFANNSFRFLSGSLDGSTRIWSYVNMNWKCILLRKPEDLYPVSKITWNCDDTLVITAQERICFSSLIRVWKSHNGQMFHELKSLHMEEVNSLETHPTDSRLLLSASDDGNIILWNILTGRLIKKILNWVNKGGLTNAKWSCLNKFAVSDCHGSLTIYAVGDDNNNPISEQFPNELVIPSINAEVRLDILNLDQTFNRQIDLHRNN